MPANPLGALINHLFEFEWNGLHVSVCLICATLYAIGCGERRRRRRRRLRRRAPAIKCVHCEISI